MRQKRD
jgi:hypothetical protein